MEQYIISVSPSCKSSFGNIAIFKFLCKENLSDSDFEEYFKNFPERRNIMHVLYYMGTFCKYDSTLDFITWFDYVKSQIDTIVKSCNYEFNNSIERNIVVLGLALRTFYIPNTRCDLGDISQIFTDSFLYELCCLDENEISDEILFYLRYVACAAIDSIDASNSNNYHYFIKLLRFKSCTLNRFEDIDKQQKSIIYGST